MKEGKGTSKKTNTKKNNYKPSNSNVKEVKVHEEVEKVKEKVNDVDDFLDDDEDDKRLIVFIALAILVIVATVIGLLVGCKKEEKEVEEPKKPDDTIVVPSDDEEEDEKVVEEEEVVKKVVAVSTTKKTTSDTKYKVTFYLNGEENVKKVNKGNKVSKYTPDGYTDCKYYTDENMKNEYNFNTSVNENKNIYMVCKVIHYEVIYDNYVSNNPTEYTVEDGNITLSEPIDYDGIFQGWYLNSNKITKLTKDIINYANKNNQIYLTAKIVDHLNVNYYDYEGKNVIHDEVTKDTLDSYGVQSGNDAYCSVNEKFLGWAMSSDSNNISSNIRLKEDRVDKSLYAVCGAARVVYKSGDEEVVVGYNEQELEEYELPNPEDLGMEVPTYFVPVDEETLNSKKVVSDDKEYLEDNEIKLSEVSSKSANGYTPKEGDNVEEKEKVFKGWKETETKPLEDTVTSETTNPDSSNQNVLESTESNQDTNTMSDTTPSSNTEPTLTSDKSQTSQGTESVDSQNQKSNELNSTTETETTPSEVEQNGTETLTEPTTESTTEPTPQEVTEPTTSTDNSEMKPEEKAESKEEVVPEDYKPEENKDTTLEAVWEEQPIEGVGEEI